MLIALFLRQEGLRYLTPLSFAERTLLKKGTADALDKPASPDGQSFYPNYHREERRTQAPILAYTQLSSACSGISTGNHMREGSKRILQLVDRRSLDKKTEISSR